MKNGPSGNAEGPFVFRIGTSHGSLTPGACVGSARSTAGDNDNSLSTSD